MVEARLGTSVMPQENPLLCRLGSGPGNLKPAALDVVVMYNLTCPHKIRATIKGGISEIYDRQGRRVRKAIEEGDKQLRKLKHSYIYLYICYTGCLLYK